MNFAFSDKRTWAWGAWIIASVFYAYQYVLRVMPSIMLTDIMEQFNINAATFGQFSGVYYIGYSLMHLPIGIMLDRFGPKKVMTLSIILTVLGLMPLLFSNYWLFPIIGRFFVGLGSSAAILGVFKIIRMTFKEKEFPRMLSFSVTIGLIGAIYGGGPVSYLKEVFGYQTVIEAFAFAGIGLALITYWLVPEIKKPPEKTIASDIKSVLSNAKVIWTCVFAGLMVGPLEGFADVWGAGFLKHVYGFDSSLAASMPSVIFVGMCFGAPLLSFIAGKIGYVRAIIGAGITMATSFALLLLWQMSIEVMMGSFILVGISSAYQILAIYKASTYVQESVAGLTTAIANMIIMIFGYLFHSVIGGIINLTGGEFAPFALICGTSIIPITLSIGVCGFLVLYSQENAMVCEK